MAELKPESEGLVWQRLRPWPVPWTDWRQRLTELLRGAPKLSLLVLAFAAACAIFAPWLAPHDPVKASLSNTFALPSLAGHLLGTDHLGRDILSRLIYGARISVTVGFLAVFVSGAVGSVIAVLSGFFRGWLDGVLMQLTDGFMSLPFLMVAVTVISMLGPSLVNVIMVIGLLRWMSYARILRSEVLKISEMPYVRLAVVAGASKFSIMARHVFPNLVNTLLIVATLELGTAVIFEAALSFLGLGIPRPLSSLGTMLAESQPYLYNAWWLPLYPGIAISLLVMASNLTGDWLRDRLDPTRRQL
jgi:peptide/nickel transport system permease protein